MPDWDYRVYADTDDSGAWDSLFDRVESRDIYSSPAYIRFLARQYGQEAEVFHFGDADNYVLHAYLKQPVSELPFLPAGATACDLVSSWYYGGPLVAARDAERRPALVAAFVEAFDRFCCERGYVSEFIRFDPILGNHIGFEDLLGVRQEREIAYVDLARDEATIWDEFEGRCRTSIRRARKDGVTVRQAESAADIAAFSAIYQAEMQRKSAPGHYRFDHNFFVDLLTIEFPEETTLFLAELDGRIVGGTICTHQFGIVHDYLMASDVDYWKHQPNNILLYEAILWAKRAGFQMFDLQGGRERVFKFKQAFSPLTRPFYVASMVHDQTRYNELSRMHREHEESCGASPLDPASKDFFPAYRRRILSTTASPPVGTT